ncbi:uncharacterized protein B4 [Anabrus simplex]|uniref:uncharacterized protein B4 n=1 Tax=Anabrus simplex TaxID=316456 RepID=UPI0035A29A6F
MSDISAARSGRRSLSSHSGTSNGRHSTMPTYPHIHHPIKVAVPKHSSSLEYRDRRSAGPAACLERLTPRQFVEKYSLPRVVRVVTGDSRAELLGPLGQPLLLYKQYRSTKVLARSVSNSRQLRKVGPALVIPDCYQGWFCRLTAKGQPAAHCYTSIQQLVAARVTAFLPRYEVQAYRLNDSSGLNNNHDSLQKNLQYTKTTLKAGHAIKLLAVFEDVNHVEEQNNRRISFPFIGRLTNKANKYAQCLNGKSQMVFIPLTTTGQFYAAAATKGVSEHQCVTQMTALLKNMKMPLPVHLVMGPLPTPLPAGFTGNLLLEGFEQEDVILACTLPQDFDIQDGLTMSAFSSQVQPKFLEIDADSQFLLSRPILHPEYEARLFKSPLLQSHLSYCRDKGEVWRRQFKVTHHICPTVEAPIIQPPLPQVNKEKLSKSLAKLRLPTKKSSSFTYTSANEMTEQQLVIQVPQQEVYEAQNNVLIQARTKPHLFLTKTESADRLQNEAPNPAIARYTRNYSMAQFQGTPESSRNRNCVRKPNLSGNIQNRELPSIIMPVPDDLPYSRVADAIVGGHSKHEEEENVYAEICEYEPRNLQVKSKKLDYFFKKSKEDCYYVQLDSDINYSRTVVSLTESEANYDTVC